MYVSVISLWELQIKLQLGKLKIDLPLRQIIAEQIGPDRYPLLHHQPAHILDLAALPPLHNPFDRALITQSRVEQMPLITHDGDLSGYPVDTLW